MIYFKLFDIIKYLVAKYLVAKYLFAKYLVQGLYLFTKLSLLICFALFITNNSYPIEATLIDFSVFEKHNKTFLPSLLSKENSRLYSQSNFRKIYYENPDNHKLQNFFFKPFYENIPQFSITHNDISFDKWIINYYPHNNPNPFLNQNTSINNKVNNLPKHISKNAYFHIHFPSKSNSASIKPPFRIYPHDKMGNFINLNNGIILNAKNIKKISMRIGFTNKNFRNVSLSIILRNHKNITSKFKLGFFNTKSNNTMFKYFSKYNGKQFDNKYQIKPSELKKYKLFYKALFVNNSLRSFDIVKHQNVIYSEDTLVFINSNYIPHNKKINFANKKQAYPQDIPFLAFESIILKNNDLFKVKNFQIFLKDIKIYHDKYFNDDIIALQKQDDSIWNIISEKNKLLRHKLEVHNAKILLNLFDIAKAAGIYKYDDFKKFFNYSK